MKTATLEYPYSYSHRGKRIEDIRNLHSLIFPTFEDGMFDDMKRAIAQNVIKEFPLAPEDVLEFCLRNHTIPTSLEYNLLCEEKYENFIWACKLATIKVLK